MTKIATTLLAGTALFGLTVAAQAADMGGMLRGPAVVQPVAEAPVSSGWYLRGDVGVGFSQRPSLESIEPGLSKTFISRDLGDQPFVQLGIGYQFSDYLRGDVTAEYRGSARLRGTSTYASTYGGNPSTNFVSYDTNVRSLAVMANGYIDLGHYSGLTPYVGAGIGAAYNQMDDVYTQTSFYVGGSPQVPQQGIMSGSHKWNLAWALHGGMSWDVNPNLKVDVGYSYKDFGSLTSGIQNCMSGSGCNEKLGVKHLAFHDVRIGARWMIDPVVRPAPVYGAPVFAKN
ncbi:MAG: outer membrane beta-barrel protein [Siculibacillus sp.]